MTWLLALLAAATGMLNTVQGGTNATLNKMSEAPVFTAFVVAFGNALVYLAAGAVVGFKWPDGGKLAQVPWWAWTGGLLGGLYVLALIFLAQKLGSAVFTGVTVTVAITTSVLLDHFGLVGFEQHSAGLWRVVGCLLMIGGLALVSAF